jgi:hypothetical protein
MGFGKMALAPAEGMAIEARSAPNPEDTKRSRRASQIDRFHDFVVPA